MGRRSEVISRVILRRGDNDIAEIYVVLDKNTPTDS
jgi:hypothetical protein